MPNAFYRRLCFLRAACVLAALVASGSSEAADITYETRALTGTDGPLGPGLGAGVHFRGFSGVPALNDTGQTTFWGTLAGPGVVFENDNGIWSEGGGAGLALVARKGSQAPGTATGVNFSSSDLIIPVLNGAGQTAFWSTLAGVGVTGANDSGIWSGGGGSGLALVAREGSQAPGTAAGVNFGSFAFASLVLNGAGQTAFRASLTGTDVTSANESGIWSEGGGSGPALVARTGHQAPGTPVGVNFSSFSFPVLNGAGQTAFWGTLTGPGVTSANEYGIWSEGGGSGLALVASMGHQAPGTAVGVNFNGFSRPVLDDAGQTTFVGYLIGAGVDNSNDQGIWREGAGSSVAIVARKGSQAPGTDPGVTFSGFGTLSLNGAGQIAFMGGLTGAGVTSANNRGIWSEGGGSGLALVAREGSQAPGTAEGVVFSELTFSPVINDAGQAAFMGDLTSPGVTPFVNSRGIWATDLNGKMHLIVREGDLFDVNNDPLNPDPRTISSLNMALSSNVNYGRAASLNNAGQLAFWLRFTDGSEGIFVATIATFFKLTITRAIAPATGYDFTWVSRPGKVYDLVTSTDPATPVAQWPVHAGYGDIPANGTTTALTAVPVTGPQRFFAVIEKDAAPAN